MIGRIMLLSQKLEQDGFYSGRDWPSMSCKKCVSKRSWRPSASVSITAATSTQWTRRTNGQKLGKKCFRVVRFSSKKCAALLLPPDDDGLLWRVFPLSQHSVAEKRVLRLVFRSNYIFPIFIFDKFRWKKLLRTDFRVFRKNFWIDPKPGNHDFFFSFFSSSFKKTDFIFSLKFVFQPPTWFSLRWLTWIAKSLTLRRTGFILATNLVTFWLLFWRDLNFATTFSKRRFFCENKNETTEESEIPVDIKAPRKLLSVSLK